MSCTYSEAGVISTEIHEICSPVLPTGWFLLISGIIQANLGNLTCMPDCLFFPGNIIIELFMLTNRSLTPFHASDRRHCNSRQRGATKHQETSTPESQHDFSINGMAGFVTNGADAIRKNRAPSASAAFNWIIFRGARTIKECRNNITRAEIRNGIRHGILSISNSLIRAWLARQSERVLLSGMSWRPWTESEYFGRHSITSLFYPQLHHVVVYQTCANLLRDFWLIMQLCMWN